MKKSKKSKSNDRLSINLTKQSQPTTVGGWIVWLADQIQAADICLENGTQEPYLEAEYLISYSFSIAINEIDQMLERPPPADADKLLAPILDKRIKERLPAAYITQEAFFAGYRFFVDKRVLIPRSRIENIFDDEEGFAGLLDTGRVENILDLCTGSGCLAVTLALSFPWANVDGSDVSTAALEVAAINRKSFGLEERLRLVESDLFAGLAGQKYDLIVSNPPYVSAATMASLPAEYCHEPALALAAGSQGLDLIIPILQQAPAHLNASGMLLCEVGDETQEVMEQR